MSQITFVDYLVNFLRPYKDEPFFVSCVMKALKKLEHPIAKACLIKKVNDVTLQKDLWCNE